MNEQMDLKFPDHQAKEFLMEGKWES